MMKRLLLALGTLLRSSTARGQAIETADVSVPVEVRDGEFVSTRGRDFVLGSPAQGSGTAFRFLGANVSVTHGPLERTAVATVLDRARADGLTVVRVWALGEAEDTAPAWADDYAIRRGRDGFLEASLVHLDRVLAEARKRNLRVILVLANRWADYGGVPQYLRWAGIRGNARTPGARDTDPSDAELERFFSDPEIERMYQTHVRALVTRTNSLTRTSYADDPAIFSWELMNESHVDHATGQRALVRWVERQSAFIRSLGAQQMISAGHIGWSNARMRRAWRSVHEVAGVSYVDAHVYSEHDRRVRSEADLARLAEDLDFESAGLQKPLVIGEFGFSRIPRSTSSSSPSSSPFATTSPSARPERADLIARLGRALFSAGAAGALVWQYETWNGQAREHAIYEHEAESEPVRVALRTLAHALPVAPRDRAPSVFSLPGPRRGYGARSRVTREAGVVRVVVPPLSFRTATFRDSAIWHGPSSAHFWGLGTGRVSYRFNANLASATRVRIRLRASTESPLNEPETMADLAVFLNGSRLAHVALPEDDGRGASVEIEALLPRASRRRGTHRLTFVSDQKGICIYGGDSARIEINVLP